MPLKRRRKRKDDDETSYWLSYSDMMAALLLVFVLIISFTMLQSKRQYEEKEAKLQEQQSLLDNVQDELDDLKEESLKKESEIEEKDKLIAEHQKKLIVFANWESERAAIVDENNELEIEVEELESELAKQKTIVKEQEDLITTYEETIAEQESEINTYETIIEEKDSIIEEQSEKLNDFTEWDAERDSIIQEKNELETELAKKESEIESKQLLIDNLTEKDVASQQTITELVTEVELQAATIESQVTQMLAQEATVEAQQEKLDKLIGIRSELVETLKKEFENSSLNVIVDEQTGAITFDSGILFDFAQSEVKLSGKDFLNEFLPRYISILQESEYESYIAEIIIEGHTDSVGSYLSNLSLSQNRALAVARYCLADDGAILEKDSIDKLRKIVTANGRSFSNLIYNEDGTENADASRRVEFKFRLKDEEMIQEMRSILEN